MRWHFFTHEGAVATEFLRDMKNTYVKGDFDGELVEI
jgi:hypothetical protein